MPPPRRGSASTSSCGSTRSCRPGRRKRSRASFSSRPSAKTRSGTRESRKKTEEPAMSADLKATYAELTAEGTLQVQRGDFRQAAEQFELALKIAREVDDQHLIHRATCNLSTARLSLGQIQEAEKGLREILLK